MSFCFRRYSDWTCQSRKSSIVIYFQFRRGFQLLGENSHTMRKSHSLAIPAYTPSRASTYFTFPHHPFFIQTWRKQTRRIDPIARASPIFQNISPRLSQRSVSTFFLFWWCLSVEQVQPVDHSLAPSTSQNASTHHTESFTSIPSQSISSYAQTSPSLSKLDRSSTSDLLQSVPTAEDKKTDKTCTDRFKWVHISVLWRS